MGHRHTIGDIPGVPRGTWVASRRELATCGVHPQLEAGISGTKDYGAVSIVLNGGYEDDDDRGSLVVYTGQGGLGKAGRQVSDQELTRGNRNLVTSCERGNPVRVSRGPRAGSSPPTSGYRYDGLYRVDRYWPEKGRSGHRIWRFLLYEMGLSDEAITNEKSEPSSSDPSSRRPARGDKIDRDVMVANRVKEIYRHECQVCGVALAMGPAGPYAEAAHIKPLGHPHDGPDRLSNVLCLCPNHHKLLDRGGITIDRQLVVSNWTGCRVGDLIVDPRHKLDLDNLNWHRELWSQT